MRQLHTLLYPAGSRTAPLLQRVEASRSSASFTIPARPQAPSEEGAFGAIRNVQYNGLLNRIQCKIV